MKKSYDIDDLFRNSAEADGMPTRGAGAMKPLSSYAERPMVQVCGKVTKKATYELDAELLERVNRFASSHDMKKLAVIERALQEYLSRNDG